MSPNSSGGVLGMEPNKNKMIALVSRLIFGTLFFIIITGGLIQCSHNSARVVDIVIDNAEP